MVTAFADAALACGDRQDTLQQGCLGTVLGHRDQDPAASRWESGYHVGEAGLGSWELRSESPVSLLLDPSCAHWGWPQVQGWGGGTVPSYKGLPAKAPGSSFFIYDDRISGKDMEAWGLNTPLGDLQHGHILPLTHQNDSLVPQPQVGGVCLPPLLLQADVCL